jgi:hypothetical protein
MKLDLLLTGILLFLFSCQSSLEKKRNVTPVLKEIVVPTKESGESNLFVSETGQVYLSWVEYLNDTTDALLFSILENNNWSQPQTIASGSDWFVNWADFPSMVAYQDGGHTLAAHWLEKSANGTYDYDVHISQSHDEGKTWTPAFIPHRDSIAAEHGFVSMLPLSSDRIFATWLDGRNTKEGKEESTDNEHSESGHHGAMSLRAATFDKFGNLYDEVELDDRVCDCCQTSAALTDKGVIVAYRDRSENEIRDIAIIRQVDEKWTSPSYVFEDNWQVSGCPVNGASIKADGNAVAIVWFSMPDGKPEVKVAFSLDSGASFNTPIRVDDGNPLGRVDILLHSEKEALVSWLEKTKEGAEIRAISVTAKGKEGESIVISKLSASRSSGFPKMTKAGERLLLAWTQVDSISTTIKTAEIINR